MSIVIIVIFPLIGCVPVVLSLSGQHLPVAADIRYLYPHSFRDGPAYDANDVNHSLYSTHQDEDTPTSITTTDVDTLDGVGGVLHQT